MKKDRRDSVFLAVCSFELCCCLALCAVLGIGVDEAEKRTAERIEKLEKEILDYQEKCERMIDTNLDIFVNKRWEK